MKQEINKFWTILSYFTRIPVPSFPYDATYLSRGTRYFPLVGAVVGGLGALCFMLFSYLGCSDHLSVFISMAATIFITGAFHEDGFADVCDGFGGGWTKEKIMTIMKDSAIGAYGAIGIILLLGAKFLMLSEIPSASFPIILIIGHTYSRFNSVGMIYTSQYVRMDESSKSKPLRDKQISIKDIIIALLITAIPFIFIPWKLALFILPLPILISAYNRHYFKRWLGGYTGDCLGANQQLTEIAIYLSAIIYFAH